MKKLSSTGLEQELNQKEIIGELVFPEIAAVARQMAAEGIVLLKNERNTLPLSVNDTVAVFGRCAVDYFTVGYGSGGDVVAPYRKNLMEGLRENGVRLYEPLAQRYSKWCSSPKNEPDEGFWGNWPMNYPEMPLKEKTVAEASENSDAALVIIGRAAGEDRENLLKKGSFYLTDRERSMLELVTAHFNRVAVIMDCGNVIDMSWTESYGDKIGAILYAWQGGMESGTALADILTGKESPSGALTDCIARNYADYPSSSSFGGKEYNAYTEDIYVGYRYFESFAKDKVDSFVAQLSPEELDQLTHGHGKMNFCYGISGNAGAFSGVTEALRKHGIPAMITADGPSGIRIRRTVSLLPCGTALASSFNQEGVERLYGLVSREMDPFGIHMLLAPGMNIHRNPLCGRNFEYYSEDPYLTGKIAAAAIRGIQSTGRSACPKHFACNNQETRRNRNDSQVSERALWEIYLKGFEIAIRESNPLAIMTSYNKVNGVWSHYHYELVTQILRQEWGYQGLVITDWWMQESDSPEFPQLRNDAYRIRAQVDVLMPGEVGKKNDPKAHTLVDSLADPGGVTLAEAQRCAANVLRFILKIEGVRENA